MFHSVEMRFDCASTTNYFRASSLAHTLIIYAVSTGALTGWGQLDYIFYPHQVDSLLQRCQYLYSSHGASLSLSNLNYNYNARPRLVQHLHPCLLLLGVIFYIGKMYSEFTFPRRFWFNLCSICHLFHQRIGYPTDYPREKCPPHE